MAGAPKAPSVGDAGRSEPAPDAPVPTPEAFAPPPAPYAPPMLVDVGARTDIGKIRETNEDAFVVCRVGRYLQRLITNLPESLLPPRVEDTGTIMMIADGMGGMNAGEVASHMALATILQLVREQARWAVKLDDPATREAEIEQMWGRARDYVKKVHDVLRHYAAADPSLAGMGTTYTAAYSVGADLFLTHIGDSRAYLFRDGHVERITRDHTLAQSYADLGLIEQSQVPMHRLSHVLTQAVGGPQSELHAELHGIRVVHGDRLLLCTDGLSNLVDETAMTEVLGAGGSSQEACDTFIRLALDRGGRDNVTAIVASFTVEGGG